MKKAIALLIAVGLLITAAVPAYAAENNTSAESSISEEDSTSAESNISANEIITYKGPEELVLTEAGETDITKEELLQKTQSLMESAEDIALIVNMDVEANMVYEAGGLNMNMDMVIKADIDNNKKDGLEYTSQKVSMTFFGMDINQESEEYIFPNADGVKVSVKKEISSDPEDENAGEWIAKAVTGEETDDTEEFMSLDSVMTDDVAESFELLDRKYTDGEKEYYVLKGKMTDVMGSGLGDIENVFGEVDSEAECYVVFAEDGMLESLYIDLGDLSGVMEDTETETTFSKFLISVYTDEPADIVIPEDVQAAGDAVA